MLMIDRTSHPWCLALILAMLLSLTGCLDLSGQRRQKRDRLLKERDRLIADLNRFAPLFTERDSLRQQLNHLRSQQEQLRTLQKLREAQQK